VSGLLYTLGHSNRSREELVATLRDASVAGLADVRRVPASRRNPHFGRAALERALAEAGVSYCWLGESLGGRQPERVPPARSPNRAWKEPAFRNYADAMATDAFRTGLRELERLARAAPTAILCAERDWRRCHRQLLADALTARGWQVVHLLAPGEREGHALHPSARIAEGSVTYPTLL
jgi:uncharacterized protein (DUF488 family)